MQEILNKLIWLWRKPRWNEAVDKIVIDEYWFITYWYDELWNYGWCPFEASLNDLCSLDSWLRQFVCEEWLINSYFWMIAISEENSEYLIDCKERYRRETNYEYRIMLSSIQEDKAKFILDNIKI